MGTVLADIDARLRAAEDAADRAGAVLRAPVLALAVGERVGSNWLSDLLRAGLVVHNEPLRQQVGAGFPLSPLNPGVIDLAGQDHPAGATGLDGLDGLARQWLVTFVVGKYATGRRHLVKETNLFFATGGLLRLFPRAALLVLARSPVGIASSFLRGGLWDRWDYPGRYAALVAATRRPDLQRWAPLLPADEPAALVGLSRLVVLNTVLLAEHLAGRQHLVVGYEQHVLHPGDVVTQLRDLMPDHPVRNGEASPAPGRRAGDDTYATTTGKDELVAVLDRGQARTVADETALRLHQARTVAGPAAAALASSWLAGGDLYRLDPPHPRPRASAAPPEAEPAAPQRVRTRPVTGRRLPARVEYVPLGGPAWRSLLVSNTEFAGWLNLVQDAGLGNTHHGVHLLATVMPPERGGRLDRGEGRWRALPGFEEHPVYWVTWIAAAAYAASQAARLPTRGELDRVSAGAEVSNCDYRVGDAVPVREPDPGPGRVHHLVGNVQVWCADGPALHPSLPAERYLHGAAWNTPGTPGEVARVRSRHLLGSSRGVGIRLVRDPDRPGSALDPGQVSARLRQWLDALTGPTARGRPLGDLDHLVIGALQGPHPPGPRPGQVTSRCSPWRPCRNPPAGTLRPPTVRTAG
jgi:hypothetical protein